MVGKKTVLSAMLGRAAPSGSFKRRILVLTAGTVAAQAVTLAAMPLLTRQYTPTHFGVFGVFLVVVTTVSLVASGRFEIAVPLPAENATAVRLLMLSLIVLACAAALIAVLLILIFLLFPGWPEMRFFTWAIPITVLAAGVFQSLSYWAVRRGGFNALSASRLTIAALAAVASLLLAFAGAQSFGLIIGYMLGQAGGAAILGFTEMRSIWNARVCAPGTESSLRALARDYREYPLVNAPHALLDGLRESGIALLIVTFFGAATNGFFSLATRVLRAPISLIAATMSQAYLQDAARLRASGSLHVRTVRLMRVVAIASAPLYALLMVFAPSLFAWLFGSEWREAGEYARFLAPGLYVATVIAPFGQLPSVAGRMRHAMLVTLADTAAKLAGLLLAGTLGDARLGVALLSVTSVVSCTYLAFWYLRISRNTISNIERIDERGGAE